MGGRSSKYKIDDNKDDIKYIKYKDSSRPKFPLVPKSTEFCNKCNNAMDIKEYQKCSHNYNNIYEDYCKSVKTTGLYFHQG